MNTGKCPSCEKVINSIRIEQVDGQIHFRSTWRCISYCCPSCDAVLSVQIDPVSLKAEVIAGVVEGLRGQS